MAERHSVVAIDPSLELAQILRRSVVFVLEEFAVLGNVCGGCLHFTPRKILVCECLRILDRPTPDSIRSKCLAEAFENGGLTFVFVSFPVDDAGPLVLLMTCFGGCVAIYVVFVLHLAP